MTKMLILTGGSQGIGQKTLQKFVKEGWQGINISRKPSQLPGVVDLEIDLSTTHWAEDLEKKLLTRLPTLSTLCLIHNAAALIPDRVGMIDPVQFEKTLALNVIVPSTLNNVLLPRMSKGSSILYIGSTLSEKAVPGCASYLVSKHAILGLMRATCQDLAGTGIHTCCICPGLTDTAMLRERCQHDEKLLEILKKISLAERFVEPAEIADILWFAANHPVLNGSVLHGNLGQRES